MPLIVTVDHAARRVLQRGVDPIALPADVLTALDEQAAMGGWCYPALSDFSEVTNAPRAVDLHAFLERIAVLSRQHGPRGPVAFIVPENLALFGMFRMYSMLADERLDTATFRTAADAEAWLTRVAASRRTPTST